MVIEYILCHVKLSYPVQFVYLANLQEIIHDLIVGLPYPVIFTYLTISLYPVKT